MKHICGMRLVCTRFGWTVRAVMVVMFFGMLQAAAQCPPPGDPNPRVPSGLALWRESSGTAQVVHGVDAAALGVEVAAQAVNGLNLVDLEVVVIDGALYFSGVFHTGGLPQVYFTNLSTAGVTSLNAQLGAQGYQPVDVETYVVDGTRYFAVVWHQTSTFSSSLELNITEAMLWRYDGHHVGNGREMDDLESWQDAASGVRYAAIWRSDAAARVFDTGLVWDDFHASVTSNTYAGLLPVDVDAREEDGVTYYTSIWEAAPAAEVLTLQIGNCYENVTAFDDAVRSNYVMVDFELIEDLVNLIPSPTGGTCQTSFPSTGPTTLYYCADPMVHRNLMEEPNCAPAPGNICFP